MADLFQYRSAPDEPLDCLYLVSAEGRNPVEGLSFPGNEGKAIGKVVQELGVRGVEGEVLVTASPIDSYLRIACFGIGKPSDFTVPAMRRLLRRMLEQAGKNHEYQIAVAIPYVPDDVDDADARAFTLAELALADYRFDRFRSRPDEATKVDGVHVVPLKGEEESQLADLLASAHTMDALVRLARDLGNRPPNDLTPSQFAAEMSQLFSGGPVRVTVMGKKDLEKEGLNGILSVGRGSVEEPRMIRFEYRSKKPRTSVALVGKGVTFDAGGISLKPAGNMAEMKYDMAGAAAVVAAMQAVAEEQPALKVTGLVPLVENLPSGSALRPGDIVTLANGTTVEIENTDAEGRLILADALAFSERFKPQTVVDLATLTGACVIALGHELAGMFASDESLAEQLQRLGRLTGDRVWRLPLRPEYGEILRSEWADIKNSGSRWGSLPASASFLRGFVPEGSRWAHLDIAGVAYLPKGQNGLPAGATGFGVRLLVALLRELGERA
jgi:leucyl aminopeptidase